MAGELSRGASPRLGMATGKSPSGDGPPSPPPRGEIFPAPAPVKCRGEHFLTVPVPARGIIPAGSPHSQTISEKYIGVDIRRKCRSMTPTKK
jgi:hypothetical protein